MKIIVEGRWNAAFSFNRKGRYPMNFFEKELRNFFGSSPMLRDAHYCGRTCLAKLDEELRVKLQFTTTGYADHYDAIKLAVINRTDGVVDQQLFRFSDIIGQQAVEGRDPINPHIWDYNGRLEWYTDPRKRTSPTRLAPVDIAPIWSYNRDRKRACR